MAHTPGPYEFDSWESVITAKGKVIARLHGIDGEDLVDPISTKGNGKLMAAAPDLLAACYEVQKCLSHFYDADGRIEPEFEHVAGILHVIGSVTANALAKAEWGSE